MTTAEKLYDEALELAQKQEYEKAFTLYSGSAELGYAPAQVNLGFAYLNGKGVVRNDQMAVMWFQKAAEQNHPAAISNLGYCYSNGCGVAVDKQRALSLYKQAADMGNEKGASNYKALFEELYGTPVQNTPVYSAPPTYSASYAPPAQPVQPKQTNDLQSIFSEAGITFSGHRTVNTQTAPAAPAQNLYTAQDVQKILNLYKEPWLPNLCIKLNGVFIAALIFFAFREFEGYPEVILALFVPMILICFAVSAFYPFHHRKRYYKKKRINEAIRCDSGNMQIAIKVYNAYPGKKSLRYITALNPAAGQLISQQLAAKK